MGFPRQEYWRGLPWTRGSSDSGIEPASSALVDGFFTTELSGKTHFKPLPIYLTFAKIIRTERMDYWQGCGGNVIHKLLVGMQLQKNTSAVSLMETAMAPHSSTLAWKIPWMAEPSRLQSMESLRVRHDWATSLSLFTFLHWRRKWQPTPVFLPEESQGQGSLVGCRLWGRTELDMTEVT